MSSRLRMSMILAAMVVPLLAMSSGIAGANSTPTTLYYGDVTIDGGQYWMPGSWDLSAGPITIQYTLDLTNAPNNACNNWGGCPGISHWSAGNVGLVWPGSSWSGAWMSGFLSDWDNKSSMFPSYPDKDNVQDLDDKFNMSRSPNPGTYDERHYNVDCFSGNIVPEVGYPLSTENYGIWFDRDGVDPYQDDDPNTPSPGGSAVPWGVVAGGTYNTMGTYDVVVEYDRSNNNPDLKGIACAAFSPDLANDDSPTGYGIPTGFDRQANGSYLLYPYGIGFDTDSDKMADMHVFVSGGVYPGGSIVVRDLRVTGYLNLDEGMATGGGWFIVEDTGGLGNMTPGGKATFGFVAKQKNDISSGQTVFQYKTDELTLKSTSYDWVTVSSTQAMFEGEGELNGASGYKFRVRAVDGDAIGNRNDRFEIRIWTGLDGFASPTHRAEGDLGGGQIVVHKK